MIFTTLLGVTYSIGGLCGYYRYILFRRTGVDNFKNLKIIESVGQVTNEGRKYLVASDGTEINLDRAEQVGSYPLYYPQQNIDKEWVRNTVCPNGKIIIITSGIEDNKYIGKYVSTHEKSLFAKVRDELYCASFYKLWVCLNVGMKIDVKIWFVNVPLYIGIVYLLLKIIRALH